MRSYMIAIAAIMILAMVPGIDALELEQDTQIQPNASTSGYFVLMDASITLDELFVNVTDAVFTGLAVGNRGCWNYDTLAVLCAVSENCTLLQTQTVINITFIDPILPDVVWLDPTSNGTEAAENDYIEWNISVTENIGAGFIALNGTNTSCTVTNDTTDSYCFYNQTGFTSNQTYCGIGWGSDSAGNWNRTIDTICRTTNITGVPAVVVNLTICVVQPMLIFYEDIKIAWSFDCT